MRLRTARASCIRCRSPVESVDAGSIKGQVAESQVHQPLCGALKGFTDALGHGTHFFRQTLPGRLLPRRSAQRVSYAQASSSEIPRSFGARAAADRRVPLTVRANIFFEKLFYPLHALFILDLGKGIFYGVDGVKIGEIQFCNVVGVRFFRTVEECASSQQGRGIRSPFPVSVSSRNGTSVRTPISRQMSVIRDHIRLFQGATAPSSIVSESSGTSVSRSTVRTIPVPPHLWTGSLAN